jgi:hypothetical protein
MHLEFKANKHVTSPNIDGENGSYSVESPIVFEKCRERFAVTFTEDLPGFYFLHQPNRSEAVASFVLKTEDILEIDKSAFAKTNRNRITWVEPAVFWKCCSMRRSLLTCLLRAGTVYDRKRDNYEEALYSEPYLGRTKKAVMRFLFGFTHYIGVPVGPYYPGSTLIVKGWLSVFEFRNEDFVKEALVLPPGKTAYQPSTDIGQALWF